MTGLKTESCRFAQKCKPMNPFDTARAWARRVKRDAMTLWFARAHPDTPWHAKALGAFVIAYALSPIDLIPDFIPILGYLDDVILLPALIWLTVRMLPPHVLAESRQQAEQWLANAAARPRSMAGALAIGAIWLAVGLSLALWVASAVL
jgi:uncharacterized membrane protein YkvA (DUF1232 family)